MAFQPIEIVIRARDEASKALETLRGRIAAIGTISIGTAVGQGITNLIGRVREMAQEFVRANLEIDGARRALNAIYKDAGLAERQLAFLRETASQAGVGFSALLEPYKSFTASATAANIPLQVQNDLFSATIKAGSTLGLSNERVGQTLLALSQMASKGVVSMEELRQQLGEALPGALSMAAKGLGLTEQELIKLVESGKLAAADLFPALAGQLQSLAGENNGLQASWERLKGALNSVMTSIGDAGGMQVMTVAVKALALAVGTLVIPLQGAVELFMGLAKTAGAALAAIMIMADGSLTSAQKLQALREVGAGLGETFAQSGARIQATSGAFRAAVEGADSTTTAVQGTANAAQQSADAATALSNTWRATGMAMDAAAKQADAAAVNATKHAEAVKLQGAAAVQLAQITGNAIAVADAESAAANANAAALAVAAAARANQLEIMRAELLAKQNLLAASGAESQQRTKELTELQAKIDKQAAETDQAKQAAIAAEAEARARDKAAFAAHDHSTEVDALRAAYDAATAAVRDAEQAAIKDRGSAEDVTVAKQKQAEAEGRLDVAIKQRAARQELAIRLAQQDAQSQQTALQAQLELAKADENRARLMGNEYKVKQALIAQKEIELKIAQLEIDTAIKQAEMRIAKAKADQEALEKSGQLTDAKRLEIESTIRAAEAEIALAKARGESTRMQEEYLNKVKSGAASLDEFTNKLRTAGEVGGKVATNLSSGWGGVATSIRQADNALSNYFKNLSNQQKVGQSEANRFTEGRTASNGEELGKGVLEIGSSGHYVNAQSMASDAKGNAITMGRQNWLSIFNQVKAMGLSEEQARKIASKAYDVNTGQYLQTLQREQKRGTWDSIDVTEAARRAAEAILRKGSGALAVNDSSDASGTSSTTSAKYVTNITIGGVKRSIKTADAASAQALKDVISQLADAKGVAI